MTSLFEARQLQSRHWRYVRTNNGRTIHLADCPRARTGTPWKWAQGRTVTEIFLTAAGSEWASCCCGFIYTDGAMIRELLEKEGVL